MACAEQRAPAQRPFSACSIQTCNAGHCRRAVHQRQGIFPARLKRLDANTPQHLVGPPGLTARQTHLALPHQGPGNKPEDVIGRNFFKDVAPCTNSDEFSGRFFKGVETGEFNAVFEYVFDYQMEPTKVRIIMIKSVSQDTYWLLIKRKLLDETRKCPTIKPCRK